jgi:hypothetical protein
MTAHAAVRRRDHDHSTIDEAALIRRSSLYSIRSSHILTVLPENIFSALSTNWLRFRTRYEHPIEFRRARLLANPTPFTHTSQTNASGGVMFAGRSRKFQFGFTFATALSFSVLPAASQAYTPEQQQACTGDAFRLCGPEIPDFERVKVCMIRNQSQLSPGCRAHFRPDGGPSVTPVGAGRPLTVKPARARKPVGAKPRKSKKRAKSRRS